MRNGQEITIIPSTEICEMRLCGLCGRTGVVNGILYDNGEVKGCWVILDGTTYNGESEWYIPRASIIE